MPKVIIDATKGLYQNSGNGQVLARGDAPAMVQKFAAPAAALGTSATTTITIAQILTGILEEDTTGQVTWTLPTNALLQAGLPDPKTGDCIDFVVINSGSVGTEEEITVAAGSGGTAVGNMVVPTHSITHDADRSGSAMFRIRLASASAYVVYRIS